MGNTNLALPEFDNPPVIEKVLGIQFDPIVGLVSSHYGWFWRSSLGDAWTKAQDAARVPDQFEKFDDQSRWFTPEPHLSFGGLLNRAMFINKDDDRLIQVQDTRFIYNWKKQTGSHRSFRDLYAEFEGYMQRFANFLPEAGLAPPAQNQWEITYVNHVAKGELWDTPADWPDIFPGLFGRRSIVTANANLEMSSLTARFEIPQRLGKVHLQAHLGKMPDEAEVLVLNLTARGPLLDAGQGWNPASGMEIGHEALVRTFVDVSSPSALAHWEAR